MRYIKFSVLFLIVLLTLSASLGCSEYAENIDAGFSTGYLLTPEDITRINESFETEPVETIAIDENTVYYWTESGSKFHFFKDCQSLSRTDSKNILSGTFDEISSSKKESPCSFCLKKGNITEDIFFKIIIDQ